MGKYTLDLNEYGDIARKAAAEGCVLIKNDQDTLPLRKGDKAAIFGRIAFNYYKSGLGSGGLVNTRYVVGILDALKAETDISLEENLIQIYEEWIKKNPYDEGEGWGQVPWSQKEMELDDTIIDAAKDADIALVVIGRTAGEDQDTKNEAGSYLLTDAEKDMIAKVTAGFERTAVILNVGNIIDMKWVEEINPSAVLYVWQGGQEGGNGVVDVLTGRVNPCGKLTDTIAKDISDYPSTADFGDLVRNYYKEDIYVGYRYFETFAKDKVLYPFGYGLSYTTFQIESCLGEVTVDTLEVTATVTNTGKKAGKEVVQVYVKSPQGLLGKPERVLSGFAKTSVLEPGSNETVKIIIPKAAFASYDDSGVTGHKSCYVLEGGTYEVYMGSDVRTAKCAGSYEENFIVVEELEEASAPTEVFNRMKPVCEENDILASGAEEVPVRTINPYERLRERREAELPYTGDKGYKLGDVFDGEVSLDDFVSQLSDQDLICMFRGEGMCSPKVTAGTAAAFGGITESLREFGIPVACCADGPSGIRMDSGSKAFSLPNGTLLGCTFNMELVESLYRMTGLELRKNKIDTLLGPGMNIHRNPLNGRNFEYISEDPFLTGKMSAVQILGLEYAGVTGTVKHFCANNQESKRQKVESVISERALREIYLKGFEIAVKEGNCRSVMTTYGPVNGIWTAGSYDLNTTILRKEWGFKGIVMTDWWATANVEGGEASLQNRAPMVAAQNDLYMCTSDASLDSDNVKEKLKEGEVTRSDLQRNAKNILTFIMESPVMLHELGRISEEELEEMRNQDEDDFSLDALDFYEMDGEKTEIIIDGSSFDTRKGNSEVFGLTVKESGSYDITFILRSSLKELAQLPVSVYMDNILKTTVSIQGTDGKWITEQREIGFMNGKHHYLKLYFGARSLEIDKVIIRFIEA